MCDPLYLPASGNICQYLYLGAACDELDGLSQFVGVCQSNTQRDDICLSDAFAYFSTVLASLARNE